MEIEDIIGKTVKRVDNNMGIEIIITFTDGTKLTLDAGQSEAIDYNISK
jgi:hypothetical protein